MVRWSAVFAIGFLTVPLWVLAQDSKQDPEQPKQEAKQEQEQPKTYTTLKLVNDFEDGVDDLDVTMSNVKKKPRIEVSEDAKEGKKACQFTFFPSPAERKDKDWTMIKCAIETWPAEGDTISFWIKSKADNTEVRVKLSEMRGDHSEYEGFYKDITEVGTEWKQVRIPLTSFQYLWGHAKDKTLQKEKISNIDFAQPDMTKGMTIIVDQIEILKSDLAPKGPIK